MVTMHRPRTFLLLAAGLMLINASLDTGSEAKSGASKASIATTAVSQLGALQIPSEVAVGEKIVASCNCPIPENGKLSILWDYSEGLDAEQVGGRLFIWGRPGVYSVSAVVIPMKTITVNDQTFDVIAGEIQRLSAKLTITGSIEPGPDPEDEDEEPINVPFPSQGFACLIIKEASQTGRMTEEQRSIFSSGRILRYLSDKAVKVDSDPFFRLWDDDYTDEQLRNVGRHLQDAYRDVKKQANGQLPWIAVTDGKKGFSGPLPKTVDETLALLRKYGG